MADDKSIVVKPREPLRDAILPQNADELAKFMDQPLTAIAESLTGALAAGPKAWTVMTGHIFQAILNGKLFQQVSQEIKELREKGKIPDDFAEKKYGFQSWVELFRIIDQESPGAERLEALKAMFYGINKTNAADGERIAAYQLFQIAKRLTSGKLLYLRACYDIYCAGEYGHEARMPMQDWLNTVASNIGHGVLGLLNQNDTALANLGLVHPRFDTNDTNVRDGHMTDLGRSFCEMIQKYRIEVSDAES